MLKRNKARYLIFRKKLLILFFLPGLLIAQYLNHSPSWVEVIQEEAQAIQLAKTSTGLVLHPISVWNKPRQTINLMHGISKMVSIAPVMAIRNSTAGFEMVDLYTPANVTWISPGISINSILPITIMDFPSNITLYSWALFYKHSAYGFGVDKFQSPNSYFTYRPFYSTEYAAGAMKPDNGVDFDEGQGGIAILHPRFELVFGKFKPDIGPGFRGNFSLSNSSPSFTQFKLLAKLSKQFHFSFHLGELESGIIDNSKINLYEWEDGNNRNPFVQRYVSNHRLDIYLNPQFRLGLYEQIIFGGRAIPFNYLNPLTPYWSAQHSGGDLDNLQMGLDFDWIKRPFRFYGALIVDEWAPFNTFDQKEERNWFGYQGGFSFRRDLWKGWALLKAELTHLTPQLYAHKFPIDLPRHHDYPIGFWSNSNSQDRFIGLFYHYSEKMFFLTWESTEMGDPAYETNADFNPDKKREVISLGSALPLWRGIILDLSFRSLNTSKLDFKENSFIDFTMALRYNIPY